MVDSATGAPKPSSGVAEGRIATALTAVGDVRASRATGRGVDVEVGVAVAAAVAVGTVTVGETVIVCVGIAVGTGVSVGEAVPAAEGSVATAV